jgi:HEAT repeat protein
MNTTTEPGESIDTEELLENLASADHVTRHKARRQLAALGRRVVPQLRTLLLQSRSERARWEAAKALGSIGGEDAVEALAGALPDASSDVRWSAVQGLIEGGESAYHPILHQLIIHSSNIGVREAAMHVLGHAVREERSSFLRPVLHALRGRAPVFEVSLAAYQAMTTYHRVHARLDTEAFRRD